MDMNEALFSLDDDDTSTPRPIPAAMSAREEREEFVGFLGGLEAAGIVAVRKAKRGRCSRCRATVLRGLDADLAAMPATVDPTPLDLRAWKACLIVDRALYVLKNDGDRWVINDLDPYAWPGSKPRATLIVPEHVCGGRFPGKLPDVSWSHNSDPDAPAPF